MKRGAAHLTIVLGDPGKAGQLRCALEAHGVDHAAVVAGVGPLRRSLLLGENDFVVLCIALDEPSLTRHGEALRRLLSDHQCFPTTVRTVGLLSGLGLNRQAAELGCNVYVDGSARAAEVIHLLEDGAWPAEADPAPRRPAAAAPASRWSIRGRWMFGSPDLPAEFASLVAVEPANDRGNDSAQAFSPGPIDGSGGEFGDRFGPL
ncbi:MAG: hypothetical protein ACYSXF_06160 [Planctomycetota bacterium]|jgi:hypothetical protein